MLRRRTATLCHPSDPLPIRPGFCRGRPLHIDRYRYRHRRAPVHPASQPTALTSQPTVPPPTAVPSPVPTAAECPAAPTPRPAYTVGDSGVQSDGDTTPLRVEVAASTAERQYGLMYYPSMGDGEGMLFVYRPNTRGGHWMANTCLPLDIAYLDAQGRVMQVVQGKPFDKTPLYSRSPFTYVLEVNVGWFDRYGHGVGSQVIIPPGLPAPGP